MTLLTVEGIWLENTVKNFQNPTPDSDSPYPITFGQTLWRFGISSVGTTIDEKNLIKILKIQHQIRIPPYPIT